ncbi:hypothetical protein EDD85DRAFT_960685 [Armillaria nabsnona]|nr:hypothetical protein EDD85DRAFT_960685 [Armillaria nabsnona]
MFNSILVVLCLPLVAVSVKRTLPIFEIDYEIYPQSAKNISGYSIDLRAAFILTTVDDVTGYSGCCVFYTTKDFDVAPPGNNGPRAAAPNRPAGDKNRASNSCGKVTSTPVRSAVTLAINATSGLRLIPMPAVLKLLQDVCFLETKADLDHLGEISSMYIFSSEADYVYATLTSVSKNNGPQASGHVLWDSVDHAEIRIVNVPYGHTPKKI